MTEHIHHINSLLSEQFNNRLDFREKRPGIFQLFLPFYHEDGDMVEVYLDLRNGVKNNSTLSRVRINDFGMSLMRLSYSYEIDTPNKEKILHRILAENNLVEQDGQIIYDAPMDALFPALMQYCQTVAKISNMRQFKREVIESLFYEMLDDFVMSKLGDYNPEKSVTPIPERDDLEVDYQFTPNGHPVYLFGVKDTAKARLATISCLEFLRVDLRFKSYIVHEDFEKITRKDRSRLTSACDKQFPSLDDFNQNARKFLDREASY